VLPVRISGDGTECQGGFFCGGLGFFWFKVLKAKKKLPYSSSSGGEIIHSTLRLSADAHLHENRLGELPGWSKIPQTSRCPGTGTATDPHPEHRTAHGCGLGPPAGNIPWEGDPATVFHYKMFKFRNNGGKTQNCREFTTAACAEPRCQAPELSQGLKRAPCRDAGTVPAATAVDGRLAPSLHSGSVPGSAFNHQQIQEQRPHPG